MKLLCDSHSHTIASTHAYSTVHDYFRDAKARGLQLFSMTDHAPTMPDSPHFWHFVNMRVIPRVVDGVAMLRGIEANIQPEPFADTGRYVDLIDRVVPLLDFAIASFHEPVCPPSNMQENTQRMIRAIEGGDIQIVGHPGNPNFEINQEEVVRAAKDNNVLIEINNSSFGGSRMGSTPFCLSLIELVDKHNWKISVGSDAHISFDVGNFEHAIAQLTQAGFDEQRIVTANAPRFLSFLTEHGKTAEAELSDWLAAL